MDWEYWEILFGGPQRRRDNPGYPFGNGAATPNIESQESVVLLRPTCIEDIEVPCVSFGVCSYERYLDCRLQNHGNAQIVKHPSDFRSIPSIDIARVSCLKA